MQASGIAKQLSTSTTREIHPQNCQFHISLLCIPTTNETLMLRSPDTQRNFEADLGSTSEKRKAHGIGNGATFTLRVVFTYRIALWMQSVKTHVASIPT
jgi:hypothetical protein